MAFYLVRANPKREKLDNLKERLESGEIREMRPFGTAIDYSLRYARIEEDGTAVWEEEDYCTPPLRMEREAVLDSYFDDLAVERVEKGKGWQVIETLPQLWD